MNRKTVLYAMFDSITDDLLYIGITVDFNRRCKDHLKGAAEWTKKALYVKHLQAYSKPPYFKVMLEFDNFSIAREIETLLIREFQPFLNTRDAQ